MRKVLILGSGCGGTIVANLLPAAQQAAFGIVIILFLILEPEGLAKLWKNVKNYFRVWPFSY